MSFRFASLLALSALFVTACQSTPTAPQNETQAIVESVAKMHPEVTRLTVHTTPAGGSGPIAVASTMAEKLGKPSDPEDLKAMAKNLTVTMEEVGSYDVTVPICMKDGKPTAAVGVTFNADKGTDKENLKNLATAIAKVVEDRMTAAK
ncbi:MAG: hypothetical protein KA020_00830 [Planctomycetes bacterium]|nr:hypothetical protein [Planctomycetota bacterium]